jgi:prepilin-type N-terminal cleavage/methylation domain-containing protein
MERISRFQLPQGFTLIEVILSIVIVSIAVLTLVSSISFTASRSLNADVVTAGKELAQQRMEFLISRKRDVGYGAAELAVGTTNEPALPAPFANYARTTVVCLVNATLTAPDCNPALPNTDVGYKQVSVSVTYPGLPDVPNPLISLVSVVADARE